MRLALHLGYRPPFEPMFRALVGEDDPLEHVAFAAAQGFAGVLDAAARRRPIEQQAALGEAIARHGLEAGCVLYTDFANLKHPAWSRQTPAAREWIEAEIEAAICTARRLGSRRIAVLGGADAQRPRAAQHRDFAEHLKRAGDAAAAAGMTIVVEHLNEATVPGMLLHRLDETLDLLGRVDHPAVRLIFDTGHVAAMDGPVLPWLQRAWPWVETVQIADQPGRVEPGAGRSGLEAVFEWLDGQDYPGLVELEHGWTAPGLCAEKAGLRWLTRWLEGSSADRTRS
jgi:hydroxypyruvate isomerase